MFGRLSRLARDIAIYDAESASVGRPVTTAPMRHITHGNIDDRAYPNDKMEKQLEAFRGTTYAAVDKIARRFAQLNMNLFTCEHGAGQEEVKETRQNSHPLLTLLSTANGHRPHEEYSVWEMKYTWAVSIDMTGESWWLTERDSLGRPSRITPLPSNRMTVVFDKDTGLTAGHFFTPKGTTINYGGIFFPRYDWKTLQANPRLSFITHWRYPSPRGIEDPRGWSPVKAAAYAYDINLFEQIYKKNFLEQGAQLGGVLQSEIALNKDQIEEYLDQFRIRHSGIDKAGLPMVLPKALKWTTTEPTPRDLQWAEAINLTQSQILQIYGISDAKLGRADIGNRNTADAVDATFNREVIQSRCDTFESKFNSDFLPIYPGQSDSLYFTARLDNPVPADNEMKLKQDAQDINLGIRTPNELRAERKQTKFGKYGDTVYKQLATVAVDPFGTTLELAQDDAGKLGFVDPADQAKLDADAASEASKNDTNKDDQKDNTKK